MICIYCRQREATTNDIFCQPCADEIGPEGMQMMRDTLNGRGMLLHKAWNELVQVVKAELLKPFRKGKRT